MPQIIYTDMLVGENGSLLNTTPAATYAATDLSIILDLIAKGEIRCGTGVPLDVNWNDNDNGVPWSTDSPVKAGNPWSQY